MAKDWECIAPPKQSFAGLPVCVDPETLRAALAVIGLYYTSPYPDSPSGPNLPPMAAAAPEMIRQKSTGLAGRWQHYDFDFDGPLCAGREIAMADLGDVNRPDAVKDPDPAQITRVIKAVLGQGALPFILGNDEGGLAWVLRAYEDFGPVCLVHIDAHIDWRDERDGVREGYSSGIRRASELPWVQGIAQIGLRGSGSARQEEVDLAQKWGAVFIKAQEVHQKGIEACLPRIPGCARYYLSIDCDALDLAMAPAVLYPSPGGLNFHELSGLMRGLCQRGDLAGISIFEYRPHLDQNLLTACSLVHLAANFIGCLAHADKLNTGSWGR